MSTRTPGVGGRAAAATLRWSGGSVTVPVGGSVMVGRALAAHVRIGRDDPFVSRRACAVVDLGDCLWVRNLSTSKPVTLRRTEGEDVVVEPGRGATTTPGEGAFDLLFVGRHRPEHHVVRVEPGRRRTARTPSTGLDPLALTAALGVADVALGPEATVTRPARLTPAEQRVLDALVLPMTTRNGPAAAPATYAQMETMLGLKSSYLRNVVRRIRDNYAAAGVADLSVDDGDGVDVRRGLALWECRARRAAS